MVALTRRHHIDAATIYVIADATPEIGSIERFVEEIAAAGAGIVQLRDRRLDDRDLLDAAQRFASACRGVDLPFIVNDRLDIALACKADGVHVGQNDVPVNVVRQLLGNDAIIGLSTHSPQQIDAANKADVEYIGVGPVHETPTKPGRAAAGLPLVQYAAAHAKKAWFAIGGLDANNLSPVLEAGAQRISVLRCVTRSRTPGAVVRELVARMQQAQQAHVS